MRLQKMSGKLQPTKCTSSEALMATTTAMFMSEVQFVCLFVFFVFFDATNANTLEKLQRKVIWLKRITNCYFLFPVMIQKPIGGVKKNNVGNYCVVNFRADLL